MPKSFGSGLCSFFRTISNSLCAYQAFHICNNIFFFKLAERNSLPKWALTSFPGSGVTWTRQLIEGVTGIYTGSVYLGDSFPVQPEGFFKINTI